ncbi:19611_t:CDS:2, partial [Dentiscutata erythropus]
NQDETDLFISEEMSSRRVVITGLGLVTPLSTGVKSSWKKLINSECGIISLKSSTLEEKEEGKFNELSSTVAGKVKPGKYDEGGFDPKEWLDPGDERKMALFTQYAICAAKQALNDAEWAPTSDFEKERTGPNHAVSTACTTGAHAIGDASRFIQFGDADVMIAGGSEACVLPLTIAGFAKAKSLATKYNDRPEEASRPFDRDRDGFVISEGAGVVLLEEYNHAKNRGARMYAEIRGYGLSGDAYHMTAPLENGAGAELAMRRALNNAKLSPKDIDYINAHATSTLLGDIAENRAIKSIFESSSASHKLAVSSSKGSIGHLLGAAGAAEGIFTILALYNNILPPTLNLYNPGDPASDFLSFNYVPLDAQQHP